MTLIDSGPLVAIYLPTDRYFNLCVDTLSRLSPPLVTTRACFTEAMYLVGKERGWSGQEDLWHLQIDGRLQVHAFSEGDLLRMYDLMKKYRDAPMDIADASLVTLAERLNETLVFTLDSHFRAYRLRDRRALRVMPEA